ncbi:MAG: hypothetical protein D6724_01965 [Armatimonadetes bacterium]|nr:MAG: hypothetical protein D6724_01965 [Armatimonadota bacterium]
MKEQVIRILKMVQEGRLSPEDAYELMDAFVDFGEGEPKEGAKEETASEDATESASKESKEKAESFSALLDMIEKVRREIAESVQWQDVAEQIRSAATKGVGAVKATVDRISKGGVHWFGPVETRSTELPLEVPAGKRLRIERTHGDVIVTGGAAIGQMKATVTVRGADMQDARSKAERWTPVIEESDGVVLLKQSTDTLREDVEISVPAGVEVEVHAESGQVRVRGTEAPVRVTALAGDVSVENVSGRVAVVSHAGDVRIAHVKDAEVEIENRSGDVSLSDVHGSFSIRSAAGGVKCSEVTVQSGAIETVRGDVLLQLVKPFDGALTIRTVSGNVLADIDGASDCRVALSSVSGAVNTSISLEDLAHTRERITGRLGEGKGCLEISTVSGAVNLHLND